MKASRPISIALLVSGLGAMAGDAPRAVAQAVPPRSVTTAFIVAVLREHGAGPIGCDGWRRRVGVRRAETDGECRITVEVRETVCTIGDCFEESTSLEIPFDRASATISVEERPTCGDAAAVVVDLDGDVLEWQRVRNVDGTDEPPETARARSATLLVDSSTEAARLGRAFEELGGLCFDRPRLDPL